MPLTWALAIATYDRPEALRRSVLCAIEQTRPPCEIIIVDSSPNQRASQQDIHDLVMQRAANLRLHYLRSPIAQQTIQRNLAIDASSADVLFMIDDDAYMYPGCAEKVMTVFEADVREHIAAVGPATAANPPATGGEPPRPLGIPLPRRIAGRWAYALFELWYWPYKQRYPHFDLPAVSLPIRRTRIIHGYRMIVRRVVARTCRFDENLAAGLHEDLDASYRFGQQGALVELNLPLIYHDRGSRPASQPRKGSIQRYSWIAGHVYLARQYFGHSRYVRLHAYFSMWRYLPLDLIYAMSRGDAAQLRGTLDGLKAAWRLAMASAARTGSIYAAGCRAYREQLIVRGPTVTIREMASKVPMVRPFAIGLLRLTKTDIRIANPWTKHILFLNSFHHKGYWYFGRVRENAAMRMLAKCITAGDTIVEIGGHIGFISQYLSNLVGETGRVIVFEPGSNNLPYLRKNLRNLANVTLVEVAVSDKCGRATFYEDNVTGQNNSLLPNCESAEATAKAHRVRLEKHVVVVSLMTLDAYVQAHKLCPDFIKIDIEGSELNALLGSSSTLTNVRGLMVEVTRNHAAIASLLRERGFRMFSAEGEEILNLQFSGNIFALRAWPPTLR